MNVYTHLSHNDEFKYVIIADNAEEALQMFMSRTPQITITYQDEGSFHLSNGLKFYIFKEGIAKKGIY